LTRSSVQCKTAFFVILRYKHPSFTGIDIDIDSLFYLDTHLAMVTARPIDLISRVYRTHQLVYRRAKKTE